MKARQVWLMCALVLCLPASLRATVPGSEGDPPFAFGAWFIAPPQLHKPAKVGPTMKGAYDTTASGEARIQLPEGVALVSGDTLYRCHPGGCDARWRIVVRVDREGTFELHGSLRIVGGDGVVDEAEFVMPFEVHADSAIAGQSRLIRAETVRAGQRYRYGSRYLVPVDGPEAVWQGDIERLGQKPRAPQDIEAVCATCSGDLPRNLTLVALVASDGQVVGVRRRGPAERGDAHAFEAAKDALTRTRFTPARLHGKAVADWVTVQVRILPPSDPTD